MVKKNKSVPSVQKDQTFISSINRSVRGMLGDEDLSIPASIEDLPTIQTDRNGRPVRKTRGKAILRATGYIDSSTIVVESSDSDPSSSDSNTPTAKKYNRHKRSRSSSVDQESADGSSHLSGRKRARRASSTPPPALSPAVSPLQSRASTPAETTEAPKAADSGCSNTTLQLTFNVPQGHTGPFNVNLDLAALLGLASTRATTHVPTTPEASNTVTAETKSNLPTDLLKLKTQFPTVPDVGTGFNSLPAELRNRIYGLLFVGAPFEFRTGKNFSRSAAFIRTCKRVHEEGRTVLYGENEFCLQRQHSPRGNFYDADWKEVGYKDVRRFFEMIGTVNLSLIRTVKIDFDDGSPSTSPGLTVEQRRFLNDGHLIRALKLLGKHGQLDYIKMGFYGRRYMYISDKKFLDILRAIKANKVEFGNARFQNPGRSDVSYFRMAPDWPGKMNSEIMVNLKEHMLRDPLSDRDVVNFRKWRPAKILVR